MIRRLMHEADFSVGIDLLFAWLIFPGGIATMIAARVKLSAN